MPMNSTATMNRLRKRPDDGSQRSRSQRKQSCMTAVLISSFASLSTCPSSTSAYLPPTSFVSSPQLARHHNCNTCCDVSVVRSAPSSQHVFHQPLCSRATHKRSRIILRASDGDDGMDNIENEYNDDDYDDDDEEHNELRSNLNKISWLPSVNLGKQPYNPNFGQISRKEADDGESYESLLLDAISDDDDDNSSNNPTSDTTKKSPPGYKNIEILPVLPMTMVNGMEGMLSYDDDDDDDDENNNSHRQLSVEELMSMDPENIEQYLSSINSHGMGVWEGTSNNDPLMGGGGISSASSTLGPMFSGTSSYLPHTKGHVFTVAEPRYKKLYDDLLRMGNYYGMKRENAIRRAKESGNDTTEEEDDVSMSLTDIASLPDPDEKRRFIVTTSHPIEDGVFAEYGLLFQLKDLDEVAAVASYEMGGENGEGMTLEEIQELVESVDVVTDEYGNAEVLDGEDKDDVMDILLRTHYEATHDVVGRVKIHRFVNPECYSDGPEGDEYLMAEATILDVVKDDRAKMLKSRSTAAATTQEEKTLATARSIEQAAKEKAEGEVAKAVARIKDELRSSVSEAFKQQQQLDPQKIKDKLRSALDEAPTLGNNGDSTPSTTKKGKGTIPLGPKGVYVEKRSDDSLTKEERALRESFTKLVALQHELKEECRFTRVSVQTFGIGPVGVWLSAAAWSQFVQKRLESTHGDMQSDLQSKLVEYLADKSSGMGSSNSLGGYLSRYGGGAEGGIEGETIDFDDLSPELQQEFHLVQNRATEELGPLALERAIQMQRIVQAETYTERLDLLRECVDNERRRLEAKKMLQSLAMSSEVDDSGTLDSKSISREEARSIFERLMSSNDGDKKKDSPMDQDEDAFQ